MSEENKNEVCDSAAACNDNGAAAPADCKKKCCCKKVKKVLLWIAGVIAVLLALTIIFRDLFIPVAVSNIGSFALGTEVKLKKFSSSLTGKVDIQGIALQDQRERVFLQFP